jgi:hypothetical protein
MKKFKVYAQICFNVKVDESDITEDENIDDIVINEAETELSSFYDYYINCIEEI